MKKLFLVAAALIILLVLLYQYTSMLAPTSHLVVAFLNVGQGDSIYIRAPNGNDILIDGGPDDQVIQQLHHLLPPFDQTISLVIATHPDKDHIAGLISVFDEFTVEYFLHSEIHSDTSFDRSLAERAASEPGLSTIVARRGERFILDNQHGIFLDILFPDQDTSAFKETNEASIVAQLVYGKECFLLTGDSPASVEQFLARTDASRLSSAVLKLGHHGSQSSSSDAFLTYVLPAYAIVSAGKNNSYHHPHPTVIERVKKYTSSILSTIDQGTIVFETDGATLWVK